MPPALAAAVLDALDQLPGPPRERGPAPGGGTFVTGPRKLLREALLVAVDEAGEALAARCTRLLRGEGDGAGLREAITELSGLLDLLESLD